MLKGKLLESQSWLKCPPTCAGQDVTPNSNLAGALLILYLNLLTHNCPGNELGYRKRDPLWPILRVGEGGECVW